jgi:hypothetical protein
MDFQSIALPTELPHHFTAKALCEDGLSAKAGGKNKETKSIKEEKERKELQKKIHVGTQPTSDKKKRKGTKAPFLFHSFILLAPSSRTHSKT